MSTKPLEDTLGSAAVKLGDGLSVGVVLGSLVDMLPSIAASVSIVWGLIRIYETKTVQGWIVWLRMPKNKA
jgi:hypothetical protein